MTGVKGQVDDRTNRPVLIVGLPRSGTTWTVRVLASAAGTTRVSEPDNEDKYPSALHGKRKVGRYPVLATGDRAPEYRRLWEWALSGAREGRRENLARRFLGPGDVDRIHDGRMDAMARVASVLARDPAPVPGGIGARVIAKSIHAQLAVEWLTSEFDLDVLVLLRHPANVLASWMEVQLKDARNSTLERRGEVRTRYLDRWGVGPPGPDPLEQMCWRIALSDRRAGRGRRAAPRVEGSEPRAALRRSGQRVRCALRRARTGMGAAGRRVHRGPRHPRLGLPGEAGGVRAPRRLAEEARRSAGGHPAPGARAVPDHHLERRGPRTRRLAFA